MPLRHHDRPFLSQFPNLRLLRQDGNTVAASEAFKGKKYVLIYFSAHWCPPCQRFTPLLADFYDAHKEEEEFEVLFVSSDREEGRMMDFFQNRSSNYVRRPPRLPASLDGKASPNSSSQAPPSFRKGGHPLSDSVGEEEHSNNDTNSAAVLSCDMSSGSKNSSSVSSPVLGAGGAPSSSAKVAMNFPEVSPTLTNRLKGPHVPKASGHGNWLALPFKESDVSRFLARAYSVVSIPKLVVVAVDTSCVVTREGKAMVMKDPDALKFPWRFAEGTIVGPPEGRRELIVVLLTIIVGLYYYWYLY